MCAIDGGARALQLRAQQPRHPPPAPWLPPVGRAAPAPAMTRSDIPRTPAFTDLDEVPSSTPAGASIYEQGWQSWSPTACTASRGAPQRPDESWQHLMRFRPGTPPPEQGFQAEGLLVVDPGDRRARPGVRARRTPTTPYRPSGPPEHATRCVVERRPARSTSAGRDGLGPRSPRAGDELRRRRARGCARRPRVWCSWYHYFERRHRRPTSSRTSRPSSEHDLPVDVVQIDDGWRPASATGSSCSDRFASLRGLVDADPRQPAGAPASGSRRSSSARDRPRPRAPGLADRRRRPQLGPGTARARPDPPRGAGPPAPGRSTARAAGYRLLQAGLPLRRRAAGAPAPDLTAGRGLPLRSRADPRGGRPGGLPARLRRADPAERRPGRRHARLPRHLPRSAATTAPPACADADAAHGPGSRAGFWVNDPDCLVARPVVRPTRGWAEVVQRYGGLRSFSDRVADLDEWGLDTVRRLLGSVPDPAPFTDLPGPYRC